MTQNVKVRGVIVYVENAESEKSRNLTGESTLSQLRTSIKALEDCTIYDEENFKMSDPKEKIKNFGKLNDNGFYVINAKQNKKKLSTGDVTLNQLPNNVKKGLVSSLGLLRGVRIKDGELLSASYSLFKLKNKIQWDNHCRKQLRDLTVITKTMNSSETLMACSGYSKQEIRAEVSGYGQSVGGGVAVNNSEKKEQQSFQKNEMFVANSLYSRGVIAINEQCVRLSGDFLADVDKVIQQKMAVQDLEEKYGLFYQSNVSVGASIFCTEKVDEKQDQSSSEQEHKLKVDFETSVSYWGVSGKVSGSSEHGSSTKQGNKQSSRSSSKTLKRFGDKSHYDTWAVINVNEIKSIYNLLPKDKKSQMQQIKKKIKQQIKKKTLQHGKTYRFWNSRWGTYKYLDRHTNKQSIIVWGKDSKGGQAWKVEVLGKDQVRLWNNRWGKYKYMDRHTNKQDVIAWPKDNKGGQVWNVEVVGVKKVRFWNNRWGSRKYLDRHTNKQDVIAWPKDNKGGQVWNVEEL